MIAMMKCGIYKIVNNINGKMSESQKGKILSEETKKKISESSKSMTNETKKKLSEASKGRTHSDENKKKISESQKGNIKALKQYLYQGIVYNGLQELADFLGITYGVLAYKIHRKQIEVIIIGKDVSDEKE